MAPEEHQVDPRFVVEIGAARFDPKNEAAIARRRAAAGTKRLTSALGVAVGAVPGADRRVYLVQFHRDLSADIVRRFRTEHGLELSAGRSRVAFVERLDSRTAARVRRDSAVRACILYPPHLKLAGFSLVSELGPDPVVRVGLFADADIPRLRAAAEAVGLEVVHVDETPDRSGATAMHVRVPSDDALATLTAFDDVRWAWPQPGLRMHICPRPVSVGGAGPTTICSFCGRTFPKALVRMDYVAVRAE